MTESRETKAYFWIAGDVLPHSEISSLLGLSPTRHWNQGDQGKYIQEQKQAFWIYDSPVLSQEIFLDRHIAALMDIFGPKAKLLSKLQESFEVGIQCIGYYTEANPGFHLNSELIAKVASLSVALDFDLYCLHEENEGAI